jgi:ribosomal protein S18 acetylase RimI-like enzyme
MFIDRSTASLVLSRAGSIRQEARHEEDSKTPNIMINIEQMMPHNAAIFREVRLRALLEAPSAFGSTYAKESKLTVEDWVQRAAQWNGARSILYLAMDGGAACGMAGSILDKDKATRAQLISMWTAPTHRQRGIGRLLVSEVIDWARLRGVHTLHLLVTSNNQPAIAFYGRLGFTLTGRTEPYPNDPALREYEMSRSILSEVGNEDRRPNH